jgi:threonine dehydratase
VTGPESLVPPEAVREAAGRLGGVALRTPLLPGTLPGGRDVWIKCESLQRGGAFKIRGAYNFTARLTPEERQRGLVTYSSGNHAQGVAAAARAFGVPAVIVMPEDAPRVKVEGTRALGGEVVREGYTTTERRARAEEIARETGATIVPPFDHPDVVAGQGTTALETLEQLGEEAPRAGRDPVPPSLFVVPIGGGGLISGHGVVIRALHPECRLVGVEPEGAASMKRSLEAGEPVTLEEVDTIADGLKPVRPGELTFRHVRELADDVVTVSEEALVEGLRWCFRQRLLVEPSGGATLAALLSGRVEPPDQGAVVAVASGGNVDPDAYAGWIASP